MIKGHGIRELNLTATERPALKPDSEPPSNTPRHAAFESHAVILIFDRIAAAANLGGSSGCRRDFIPGPYEVVK
jgi:hypothetical protein